MYHNAISVLRLPTMGGLNLVMRTDQMDPVSNDPMEHQLFKTIKPMEDRKREGPVSN